VLKCLEESGLDKSQLAEVEIVGELTLCLCLYACIFLSLYVSCVGSVFIWFKPTLTSLNSACNIPLVCCAWLPCTHHLLPPLDVLVKREAYL
jgi:hypothetical protein